MRKNREKIENTDYKVVRVDDGGREVYLQDPDGKVELWVEHDDNPSYTVEINSIGYEFVRSVKPTP